jgi:hypothetical protein
VYSSSGLCCSGPYPCVCSCPTLLRPRFIRRCLELRSSRQFQISLHLVLKRVTRIKRRRRAGRAKARLSRGLRSLPASCVLPPRVLLSSCAPLLVCSSPRVLLSSCAPLSAPCVLLFFRHPNCLGQTPHAASHARPSPPSSALTPRRRSHRPPRPVTRTCRAREARRVSARDAAPHLIAIGAKTGAKPRRAPSS